MNRQLLLLLAISSLLVVVLFTASMVYYRARVTPAARDNVLTSEFTPGADGDALAVMDFSQPMALDPPPAGWWHRRFLTRAPMTMSFGRVAGRHALRLATDDSASMLFRYLDIDVRRYPLLRWSWLIEDPIESSLDESTRAGDDHPARLFVRFEDTTGRSRSLEIIWGNNLQAGDSKFIGGFPHYVANGGDTDLRRWQEEEVNLLALYQQFWPDAAPPARLTDIALFCDSDETGDNSVAWFGQVSLTQIRNAR